MKTSQRSASHAVNLVQLALRSIVALKNSTREAMKLNEKQQMEKCVRAGRGSKQIWMLKPNFRSFPINKRSVTIYSTGKFQDGLFPSVAFSITIFFYLCGISEL